MAHSKPITPMSTNGTHPKVLVVDDDPMIASVCERALTKNGYEVITAATGEEALEQLAKQQFDAAVVDLVLPGIGGMEVVAAAHEADPQTVVIIITGYASLDSAIEAVRHGAFDYLRKPTDVSQLLETLQRGIAGQKLLDRNQRLLADLDKTNRQMRVSQATLKERVRQLQERLNALIELGQRLPEVHNPQAIMHHLLTTAAELSGAGAGVIFRKDPSLPELSPIACLGEAIHELCEHSIPLGSGVLGQVGASGKRQVINDLLSDPQLADDLLVYQGMRRVLAQPLIAADEVLGLIALFDDLNEPFSTEDQDLVAMLAVQAATVLAATTAIRPRAKPRTANDTEPEEFVDLESLLSD